MSGSPAAPCLTLDTVRPKSVFQLCLVFASLGLVLAVALPLWRPLILGAVLAAALAPWHDGLSTRLHGRRSLAAVLMLLALVLLVLLRVTRLYQSEALSSRARREIRDEIQRAHAGIVEAIVARDTPLARQRMRRHLDAIAAAL